MTSSCVAQASLSLDPENILVVDSFLLSELKDRLVLATRSRSVAQLESLGVALSSVILRMSGDWDRTAMIKVKFHSA